MVSTGDASTTPVCASIAQYVAPAAWKAIDFISDLHLAGNMPRTFAAWAAHLQHTPADAVFILGDLFEVWVGDDARAGGFEQACVAELTQAARRRTLGFMAGNRDFLVGAQMLAESGVVALHDPSVLTAFGRRVLVTHGDALCLADVDYQRFRAEVRSPAWRSRFLALPLAERRSIARGLRDASEARKQQAPVPDGVDIDTPAALQWMHQADAPVLVHGHTHRPATGPLDAEHIRHVLSDWDLEAVPGRAEVLRWSADGMVRLPPAAAPQ
jgi:UDP-2,3-diacylglucosamine hydrolase